MEQVKNVTHNIDKLPLEVVGMLNILFKNELEGFENAYMVEIKIDDPIKHIEDGDEFFIIHQSLDQYQQNAEHLWDKEWAIIHKDMFKNLTEIDEKRFKTLLEKYLETGKIAEKKEKECPNVQRKRRF